LHSSSGEIPKFCTTAAIFSGFRSKKLSIKSPSIKPWAGEDPPFPRKDLHLWEKILLIKKRISQAIGPIYLLGMI
jgi:hypothetical protein